MTLDKEKLEFARSLLSLTRAAFAKKIGVSKSCYSLILSDQRAPGTEFIDGLTKLFPGAIGTIIKFGENEEVNRESSN